MRVGSCKHMRGMAHTMQAQGTTLKGQQMPMWASAKVGVRDTAHYPGSRDPVTFQSHFFFEASPQDPLL
jgi:hypothetical protein